MSGRILMFVVIVALLTFPVGPLIMALSCASGTIDGWDWIFSVFVPFYGVAAAIAC